MCEGQGNPWIALITFLAAVVLSAGSYADDIEDAGIPDSEDSRTAGDQSTALWEKPIEGHIRTLLAADESKAYLGFCRAGKVEIEAWKLTDGERLWRTHLPSSCRPVVSFKLRGTRENLLIHLYYPRPPYRDTVVALNKADGVIKWELKEG